MGVYEDFAAGDADLLRALRNFDAYQGGLPPAGQQAVVDDLCRFQPQDRAAVLNQSVDRRWKRLYPLKKNLRAQPTGIDPHKAAGYERLYGPIGPKLEKVNKWLEENGWNTDM